jgi:hypothetical protein
MYLAGANYLTLANDLFSYSYIVKTAIVSVIGNSKVDSSSVLSLSFADDADGETDDASSSSSSSGGRLRALRSEGRALLTPLATVSCSFYISTSAPGVTFSTLKTALQTSSLTKALNAGSKSTPTAQGLTQATVVAVNMVNVSPSKNTQTNAKTTATVSKGVNAGAITGVVVGLAAFFAIAFTAFHYREKVCRQLFHFAPLTNFFYLQLRIPQTPYLHSN